MTTSIRPSPIERGGKMKWKLAVSANWIRDSSSGSMADRVPHAGSFGGRQPVDEVERERRAPAEPGGAEALPAERVEVLAESGVRHEAEAAQQERVGLVRLAVLDQPVPEQPVRVDPDGPAPVPALVEVLGREVVRRDDVAVGPV